MKYLILLFFILALTLYISFFRIGYSNYYSIDQKMLAEKINGTEKHDVLFFGSSRTFYQINPKVVDSVMQMRSFNAGIAGANLMEMNMILQCYLKTHQRPKYIVMDIAWTSFDIESRPFFDPNIYYSFLNDETVYNALKPYKNVFLLKHLPFLQLTEADDLIRQQAFLGLLGEKKYTPDDYFKGHLQNTNDTLKLPFKASFSSFTNPVTEKGIGYLKQIITTCKENNIPLMIIYPPVYNYQDKDITPEFFPTINEICKTYNIRFLNYREISLSTDHRLFKDEMHLNQKGSNLFSAILAKDLLKTMQENRDLTSY